MSQRRKVFLLLILGGLILAAGRGFYEYTSYQRAQRFNQAQQERETLESLPKRDTALPGDEILRNYAQSDTRPEEDLDAMAHAFSNLMLLVKGDMPFQLGANEEFAAALRGKNRSHLHFVSDTHRAFNTRGQLIDRWGTPLYFHPLTRDRVDIRSAGPDGQMWTADDLHRCHDGSFLKGSKLNPESLFDEGTQQPFEK